MSPRRPALLELDPTVVRRARTLARKAGKPVVDLAKSHTTVSVERATLRLAGLSGRRPRERPVGQPPRRRGPGERRPRARRHHPGLGRAAPRRGLRPADPGPEGLERLGHLPPARGTRPHGHPQGRAHVGREGPAHRRPPARRPRPPHQAPRRPEAHPVDLPHRRDRRHLRGHPAGPGRRARGRRRHRRHPLHRPEPARLRPRGRHPRGLRRHLRHPGELPPHAGGPRRDEQGARPLRPAHQLRQRTCACPRSRRSPASSGST